MENEKPVYTLPYVGAENYTGPYLSDGQFQSSVLFGDAEPASLLDELSRLHDTAYAYYDDRSHRAAADAIYNEDAKRLEGWFPQLAGTIVLFGNQTEQSLSRLSTAVETGTLYGGPVGALGGLIYGAVSNAVWLQDYIIHEKEYRRDVRELYKKDPKGAKFINETRDIGERDAFASVDELFQARQRPVELDWRSYATEKESASGSSSIGTGVPDGARKRNPSVPWGSRKSSHLLAYARLVGRSRKRRKRRRVVAQ